MFNNLQFSNNRVINGSYVPTEEDHENDRRMEEWQERRREEARKSFSRGIKNNTQQRFAAE